MLFRSVRNARRLREGDDVALGKLHFRDDRRGKPIAHRIPDPGLHERLGGRDAPEGARPLLAVTHVARHDGDNDPIGTGEVFRLTSFREKALSSCSQAGLVNNLNDGLAWGLFPIAFADAGLSVGRIGILAALYPAVWGLGQLVTGGLSDRIGRASCRERVYACV